MSGVFARARSGIAARRLVPVWFGLGVIAFAIAIYLSQGNVASVSENVFSGEPVLGPFSQPEIAVILQPSRRVLFYVGGQQPMPDIRVGDNVEIWVEGTDQTELWGLALRSQRENWVSAYWDTSVRFFSPETWYVREILRASGFAFGTLLAIFGLVVFHRKPADHPDQSSRRDRLPLIMVGIVVLVLLLCGGLLVLDSLRGLT